MKLSLFNALDGTAQRWLRAVGDSRTLPVVFGLATPASAMTGLFPVGPLLVAAIVIAPRHTLALVTLGALGSALGAALLSFTMHALGNSAVHGLFSGIEAHSDWGRFSAWVQRYGLAALAVFAALPVPQMPVLVLSTLNHASPEGIGHGGTRWQIDQVFHLCDRRSRRVDCAGAAFRRPQRISRAKPEAVNRAS